MNKGKIIEEMAREMCHLSKECETCKICDDKYKVDESVADCYFKCTAKLIIEQGYRKQVEAEWIDVYGNKYANHRYQCSNCKNDALLTTEMNELLSVRTVQALTPYCPNCNAKMKGADSEK